MNNTLLIQINNPKAMDFLYSLQELDLVKVLNDNTVPTKIKLSDKYKGVFSQEAAESFMEHTKIMRNEWNNT
ncbi:hypothetical protein FACS1894195_4550 [Bacteroidia bacterium]|nr:hypothetical protein FACS1894195_4550 [Bacteroidia bacterium]